MLQFVLLAAFVVPAVLFLLTQQNTLKASAVEELGKRPTFEIGIAYCILITTSIAINAGSSHDRQSWVINFATLCSLSGMICWIIYWVRLAQYKKKLGVQR